MPDEIKIAKVIPIFKAGEKCKVDNYRPISILPFVSKFFEKIVYERLYNYIEKMNIFNPNQIGFRAGISTSMSLLDLQDRISQAIDERQYSIRICLDLTR